MVKIKKLKSFKFGGTHVKVERVQYAGKKMKTYEFKIRAINGDWQGEYVTDANNLEAAKDDMKGYFGLKK